MRNYVPHTPACGRLLNADSQRPLLLLDSFSDCLAVALSDYDVKHCSGASRKLDRDSWAGTATFEDAVKLAVNGWPEGREQASKFISRLNISGRVIRPEIVYDVTGEGGVDISRYLVGDPECVMDFAESEQTHSMNNGPIVQIVYNISASCGIDPSRMMRRGAATMALVDALESAGKRVELTVVDQNDYYEWRATVKHTDAALQIDQLAFALVNPAMLRRIAFSITGQCGRRGWQAAQSGYGRVANYPYGDIFLPGMTSSDPAWNTDESATAWILRLLAEQGVELED